MSPLTGLHEWIEGASLRERAGFAPPGDGAPDETRVHRLQRGAVDAKARPDARTHAVDHDVGPTNQIEEHGIPVGMLDIEAEAPLALVVCGERCREVAVRVAGLRLYLDHVGTVTADGSSAPLGVGGSAKR